MEQIDISDMIDRMLNYDFSETRLKEHLEKWSLEDIITTLFKSLRLEYSICQGSRFDGAVCKHLNIRSKETLTKRSGVYGTVIRFADAPKHVIKYIKNIEFSEIDFFLREIVYAKHLENEGINVYSPIVKVFIKLNKDKTSIESIVHVMPYAGIDLHHYINQSIILSRFKKMSIMKQLFQLLKELHQSGYCHRDLKPANVLIDDQGKITLCDYGSGGNKYKEPEEILTTYCYAPLDLLLMDENRGNGEHTDCFGVMCIGYFLTHDGKQIFYKPADDDTDDTLRKIVKYQMKVFNQDLFDDDIYSQMIRDYSQFNTIDRIINLGIKIN